MASRGQSLTITYVAWDTSNNVGKTGDGGNHTLRWIKDGTSAAPANSPSEVDSTNAPGVYRITLSQGECTCDAGVLAGKSSTANVSIIPVTVTFEQLPIAAPAANGGLPTVDASNRIAGVQGTKNTLDDLNDLAQSEILSDATPFAGASVDAAISSRAAASTALSNVTWTDARAGYLDNINGHTAQTGDNYARTGEPAGASIAADIAAVKADTAEILVDTGTDGVVVGGDGKTGYSLTSAEHDNIADAVLSRNVDQVEAAAPEHSLSTIVLAALESQVVGTTWTIKRTDGSTTHLTKTVSTDASAEPITGVS